MDYKIISRLHRIVKPSMPSSSSSSYIILSFIFLLAFALSPFIPICFYFINSYKIKIWLCYRLPFYPFTA